MLFPVNEHLQVSDLGVGGETRDVSTAGVPSRLKLLRSCCH